MSMLGNHKELIVWQKSMDLVEAVYHATKTFPASEQFGLTSQMRRAAVSIPSNIAEGRRRGTDKDCLQFFRISFGSAAELETQIEIAKRIGYFSPETALKLFTSLDEIMRILNKFCR